MSSGQNQDPGSPRALTALVFGDVSAFSARVLWRWLEAGHRLSAYYTAGSVDAKRWRKDRWMGRLRPGWSISRALRAAGLEEARVCPGEGTVAPHDDVRGLLDQADVVISSGFMRRLGPELLALAPGRFVNLHPGILPGYRGPQVLPAMVMDRATERYGGVTLHVMEPGFDTGPIIATRHVPLGPDGDTTSWQIALSRAAGALAAEAIPAYLARPDRVTPQGDGWSVFPKRGDLDWTLGPHLSVEDNVARARGFGRELTLIATDGTRRLRVLGPGRPAGPATGAPMHRGLVHVTFDAADGRVAVRRRWPGASKRQRFRRLMKYLFAPYRD